MINEHTTISQYRISLFARDAGVQSSIGLFGPDGLPVATCRFLREKEYGQVRQSHLEEGRVVLNFRESLYLSVVDLLRHEAVAVHWDPATEQGKLTSEPALVGQR